MTQLKMNNSSIYTFYIYWINKLQNENKTANDVISEIIEKYHDNIKKYKTEFPNYIEEFFNDIKSNIKRQKRSNNNSGNLLEKYKDENYFIDELNYCLEESVGRYI